MILLKNKGYPFDESTFAAAATRGILANMHWLNEENCPWNEYVFINAAEHATVT